MCQVLRCAADVAAGVPTKSTTYEVFGKLQQIECSVRRRERMKESEERDRRGRGRVHLCKAICQHAIRQVPLLLLLW